MGRAGLGGHRCGDPIVHARPRGAGARRPEDAGGNGTALRHRTDFASRRGRGAANPGRPTSADPRASADR